MEGLSGDHSTGFMPVVVADCHQICPVSLWFCLFTLFLLCKAERMVEGRSCRSKGWLVMEIGKVWKHKRGQITHILSARRNNFDSVAFLNIFSILCFFYAF